MLEGRGSNMEKVGSPIASIALLRQAAQSSPLRTTRRLTSVQSLFEEDLRVVELELAGATQDGVAPATQAADHLLRAGGKRIRPLTVLLATSCFGPVSNVARELAVIAELVHLATLLHDDVLDDCQIRRGRPAARCLWGNAVSILSGDLLLTHALERAARVEPRVLLTNLLVTLRRLVDGEVLQLRGRTQLDLSEENYFRVVHGKTASLFEWAGRAGALCAGASEEQAQALGAFGHHLGTAFQLIDDALDYCGDASTTGKAVNADLSEGKLTLPLILAIAIDASLSAELEAARRGDQRATTRIADAVGSYGVCETVRGLARVETSRALESLERVPASRARELLSALAGDLTARVA
jgi:octaprenyl-diphosphate synthase